MTKKEKFDKAHRIVIDEIVNNPDLRQAFHANIAMAFVDNANWYQERHNKKVLSQFDLRCVANNAATYFLDQWTDKCW